MTYGKDFVANADWGQIDIGITGTGADSWLRIDDAMVVCENF